MQLETLTRQQKIEAIEFLEEKNRRRIDRINNEKTVYGIYRPNGSFGGKLVKCLQEIDGVYHNVDLEPTVSLPEKLEPLLTKKKRFKVVFGGRGGAKSEAFASIFASHAKDYEDKTLCLRELQNSIEDSVHALLKSVIDRLEFINFEKTEKAIRFKGEDVFKYKGISKNPDAVKSIARFKKSWTEEAQGLSKESLEILTPSIREGDSELWFSLNPKSSQDPMSKRFLEPFYKKLLKDGYYEDDLHLIIWINYYDNPWHSALESERAFDESNKSKSDYNHTWLGYYNDDIENALIKADWFEACIDAHKKLGFEPRGAKFAAHDASDTGPDAKGYAMRHGSVFLCINEKEDGDINDGGDWASSLALSQGVDYFTWDCDGMGVGLARQFSNEFQDTRISASMFKGSEKVDNPESLYQPSSSIREPKSNKDSFKNKRAQYYQELRDRCYRTYEAVIKGIYHDPDTLISFDSSAGNMDQLQAEVCRMPIKPNSSGLIELYTKEEMKRKFNVGSPNLADSVMMCLRNMQQETKQKYIPRPLKTMGR